MTGIMDKIPFIFDLGDEGAPGLIKRALLKVEKIGIIEIYTEEDGSHICFTEDFEGYLKDVYNVYIKPKKIEPELHEWAYESVVRFFKSQKKKVPDDNELYMVTHVIRELLRTVSSEYKNLMEDE